PAMFKVLGELEETVSFVGCFLRGLQLLLLSTYGVIVLNHGHDQPARSNLCPRARNSSGSGSAAKIGYARQVKDFVHVALAHIFVNGVVGNETHAAARA